MLVSLQITHENLVMVRVNNYDTKLYDLFIVE